jgi:hypothetical protein
MWQLWSDWSGPHLPPHLSPSPLLPSSSLLSVPFSFLWPCVFPIRSFHASLFAFLLDHLYPDLSFTLFYLLSYLPLISTHSISFLGWSQLLRHADIFTIPHLYLSSFVQPIYCHPFILLSTFYLWMSVISTFVPPSTYNSLLLPYTCL